MTQTKEQREGYIKALVREKSFYVQNGDAKAAAGVDKELKRVGAEAETPAKRSSKRVVKAEEAR